MKKSFLIPVLVFLLSLCLVLPGYCRGGLGDNDAFTTYMGKTRSEVRRIAPIFEEVVDNMYLVDCIKEGEDLFALGVMFDDYNLVESVMVLVTDGALKLLIRDIPTEPDIEIAAVFGLLTLGFESDGIIRSETDDDGNIYYFLKGGITVITLNSGNHQYTTMTVQK